MLNVSSGRDLLSQFVDEFDVAQTDPTVLMASISNQGVDDEDAELPAVRLFNTGGIDHLLPGFDAGVKLQIEGDLGNYPLMMANRMDARIHGDVGVGLADGLRGGVVRVRGNAGNGAGVCMQGGTVAVYGSAGHRTGAAMRGGGMFVRGDVGDDCGLGASGGTIVVGGRVGKRLGNAASSVSIFVRGEIASIADGFTEAPLRKQALLQLGMLLVSAAIRGDAKDFRRIVSIDRLQAEESRRGEINPNWR